MDFSPELALGYGHPSAFPANAGLHTAAKILLATVY
jgi:hypothetical protein